MLSKTQGAGEAHRPCPEPRRKAQKSVGFFKKSTHREKNIKNMLCFENEFLSLNLVELVRS
ncbi:hypothetical protein Hanom_Chr07g00603211 [Helianthus anomalus]